MKRPVRNGAVWEFPFARQRRNDRHWNPVILGSAVLTQYRGVWWTDGRTDRRTLYGSIYNALCRQSCGRKVGEIRQFKSNKYNAALSDVKNYKRRLNPVWHRMLYSRTHMPTVGVKGLIVYNSKVNDAAGVNLVSLGWGDVEFFLLDSQLTWQLVNRLGRLDQLHQTRVHSLGQSTDLWPLGVVDGLVAADKRQVRLGRHVCLTSVSLEVLRTRLGNHVLYQQPQPPSQSSALHHSFNHVNKTNISDLSMTQLNCMLTYF